MEKIGNLTSKIVSTAKSSVSQTPNSTPKPSGLSATGTAPTPPKEDSRQIGREHGLTVSTQSPVASLQTALGRADPGLTDDLLLASLTQLLGSAPVSVDKVRFDKVYGLETETISYRLPPAEPAALQKAKMLVEKSLMPPTQSECIGMLGELKLLTTCRAEQANDLEAQLMLYSRKLAEYPADVVRKVLETQADFSKWWPTWLELKERLDLYSRQRERLMKSFGGAL